MVKEVAASDHRVEAVLHGTNQGLVRTCNEGVIDWADGEYTVVLDADDRLTPGALRRAADLMDAHPNVGFVYGHPLHFPDGAEPLPARTVVRASRCGRAPGGWPGGSATATRSSPGPR